jgi:ceramide kinase
LLFLNPFGGKKDAFKMYEKFGKPLFTLAQIEVNLIVTQRAQQIHDILMSKKINLSNYDGLVCCGGDGTFSELFNGLVYRTMADMGMDISRPAYIPKPKLPIGVIPAGSTDTICYCLNGTTDIKTSIIHIILGQVSGLDISSVHKVTKNPITNEMDHTLLKLYASVISYGYLGDVAYDSERYRWMGPKRYDYSGVKKFLKNTGYNGQITVHLEKQNDPNDGVRCLDNCQRCYLARNGQNQTLNENDEELVIQGNFFMVNGANISCACKRSPNGFSPYSHLGDGFIDLVLVKHTSLFNNIRLLLTMTSKSRNVVCFIGYVKRLI